MANKKTTQSLSVPASAAKCAPVFTLQEILLLKRVADLRTIAQAFRVKGTSRMAKAELAATLAAAIAAAPEIVMDMISAASQPVLTIFSQAAAVTALSQFDTAVDCTALEQYGLLQCFYAEDTLCYVVPEEIKSIYQTVSPSTNEVISEPAQPANTETPTVTDTESSVAATSPSAQTEPAAFAEHSDLLERYTRAAVNLYGVIDVYELLDIIRTQTSSNITETELQAFLDANARPETYVQFRHHVVHPYLTRNDCKAAANLIQRLFMQPRYLPAKNEFLRYADASYYEQTTQLAAMERYLKQKLAAVANSKYTLPALMEEIHHRLFFNANSQSIADIMMESGIRFDNVADAQKAMQYIVDVHNTTRTWRDGAHTPHELAMIKRSAQADLPQPEKPKKIGRNDPCPCGSGKKYKKCCGR